MNNFLKKPVISLGSLAAILAFVLTASVGITHYFVSSLYKMEITRLRDKLESIKEPHETDTVSDSKSTPAPLVSIRTPNVDEKNGFNVGYLSRLRWGPEQIRALLIAKMKENNAADTEVPGFEGEGFLKAEQELYVRIESLGIKLNRPLDIHKLTDPGSIQKNIEHFYEQISLNISIKYGKKVYDAYQLGSILGEAQSFNALKGAFGGMINPKKLEQGLKEFALKAIFIAEKLKLPNQLIKDLHEYHEGSQNNFEEAINAIIVYYR